MDELLLLGLAPVLEDERGSGHLLVQVVGGGPEVNGRLGRVPGAPGYDHGIRGLWKKPRSQYLETLDLKERFLLNQDVLSKSQITAPEEPQKAL